MSIYPIRTMITGTRIITGSIPAISGLTNPGSSSANAKNSEEVELTFTVFEIEFVQI